MPNDVGIMLTVQTAISSVEGERTGAARYLAETRDLDGTVHFIFSQLRMRDYSIACQATASSACGNFAFRSGPMMAGGAFFDITIVWCRSRSAAHWVIGDHRLEEHRWTSYFSMHSVVAPHSWSRGSKANATFSLIWSGSS
jgi:hypothetical protein